MLSVELSGVGPGVDQEALELLLEHKRRMRGCSIFATDVTFNRDRGAALVSLSSVQDVNHALDVGSVSYDNSVMHFKTPDMRLWAKNTICVHNLPSGVSEEKIILTFERKKVWGRSLDVDRVIPYPESGAAFVVFIEEKDATHVMDRGLTTMLFGSEVVLEGPIFPPALHEKSEFNKPDYIGAVGFSERDIFQHTHQYLDQSGAERFNGTPDLQLEYNRDGVASGPSNEQTKATRLNTYNGMEKENSPSIQNPQNDTKMNHVGNLMASNGRATGSEAWEKNENFHFDPKDYVDSDNEMMAVIKAMGESLHERQKSLEEYISGDSDKIPSINETSALRGLSKSPHKEVAREAREGSSAKSDAPKNNFDSHPEYKAENGEMAQSRSPKDKIYFERNNDGTHTPDCAVKISTDLHTGGDFEKQRSGKNDYDDLTTDGGLEFPPNAHRVNGDRNLTPHVMEDDMDMPEPFTYLEARVNRRILPWSSSDRKDVKIKLRNQFNQVDVAEKDNDWIVSGPWLQIVEARHSLQVWYRDARKNGGEYKNHENPYSSVLSKDKEYAPLNEKIKSALKGIDSDSGNDESDTESQREMMRQIDEDLEKRFLNDVEMEKENSENEEKEAGGKTWQGRHFEKNNDDLKIGKTGNFEEKRAGPIRMEEGDGELSTEDSPTSMFDANKKNVPLGAIRNGGQWENVPISYSAAVVGGNTGAGTGNTLQGTSADDPLLSCTMPNGTQLYLYKANIVQLNVGAIVNAANERLQHGGGVALAIANAIGWRFQGDSNYYIKKNKKLPLGSANAQWTHHRIPAKHVINAVGPMWTAFRNKEECKSKLVCTFVSSLRCADEDCRARSVALPPISSGIFGVPMKMVAEALFSALVDFDSSNPEHQKNLREVHIVDVKMDNLQHLKSILFCKLRQFDQK